MVGRLRQAGPRLGASVTEVPSACQRLLGQRTHPGGWDAKAGSPAASGPGRPGGKGDRRRGSRGNLAYSVADGRGKGHSSLGWGPIGPAFDPPRPTSAPACNRSPYRALTGPREDANLPAPMENRVLPIGGGAGRAMVELAFQAPVEEDLARVDGMIRAFFGPANGLAGDVARHVLSMNGKRMRPTMLLLVARKDGRTPEDAIHCGAVVELIHIATLIHDDSIDRSMLRRGLPT